MTEPEPKKRVVLMQADGLNRIVGVFDPSVHELHSEITFGQERSDKVVIMHAALFKILPRYVLYRENV